MFPEPLVSIGKSASGRDSGCHCRPGLGKIREKLSRTHRKSLGQLYYILQCHIPFPTFHTANVVAVQIRSFGKFLLRVASLNAEPS